MENAWLAAVRTALEQATDADLALTRDEVDELLRLASFAARESGAKLNAPLLCYLVGRAREASGAPVAELAEAARAGAPAAATAERV
jgi:hypothetical protein